MVKYNLIGIDGNAFSVIGYVAKAMKKEGKSDEEINEYKKEAMSGNYSYLLMASQDQIDKLNDELEGGAKDE